MAKPWCLLTIPRARHCLNAVSGLICRRCWPEQFSDSMLFRRDWPELGGQVGFDRNDTALNAIFRPWSWSRMCRSCIACTTSRRTVCGSCFRSGAGDMHADFWALKNVTVHVGAGEILGIVGPNGSGKSTLLQVASGILQPTSGRVAVEGRIAALLELGAGFNPEFTRPRERISEQRDHGSVSRVRRSARFPRSKRSRKSVSSLTGQ